MRDFIGQITCGGLPIAALFYSLFLALSGMRANDEFWSKPVNSLSFADSVALGAILLGILAYVIAVLIVCSFVWLKLASKIMGVEEAKRIYHRAYRTPRTGFVRKWNVVFVDWVLKNA